MGAVRLEGELPTPVIAGLPAPMPTPPRTMDPLKSLSPTAARILKAARRVAIKGGYRALSFQSIAREAKVPKSTVMYHFQNKDTLLAALLESLVHEQNVNTVAALQALPPGPERVHLLLEAQRQIAGNTDYWQLLFVLLPEIMRRKTLRLRLQEMLSWYWAIILHGLGLPQEANGRSLTALGSVMLAVLDGLALQLNLAPAGEFDLEARFTLWEEIVEPYILRLSETLAGLNE